MNVKQLIQQESLENLQEQAIESLNSVSEDFKKWVEKVRKPDCPGRFYWAIEHTRDANVASTAYLVGGLRKMGLFDEVITEEDKKEGAAWIQAMKVGDEQYRDPALVNRKPPNWNDDEPWPAPALLGGINQYARNALGAYLPEGKKQLPPEQPPPGWPTVNDSPESMLKWLKERPFDKNAWGACSHAMRLIRWMYTWYLDGKLAIDPFIDALAYTYSIQDPETGHWGNASQNRNVRINGTFKLFVFTRDQMDLPLPYADKIIDYTIEEFYRDNYDDNVGGCDELDNWYVIALALEQAKGHREEEIKKLMAYRLKRIVEVFGKPDGGFSMMPKTCTPYWLAFDMAPAICQSDAMAPGIISGAIAICLDILGIGDQTSWTDQWMQRRDQGPTAEQRADIVKRLQEKGYLLNL